jgi:ribose-phosphate pyrophosphokinase
MQYIVLDNAKNFCGEGFVSKSFSPQMSTFPDGEVRVDLSGLHYNSSSFTIISSLFGQNSILETLFVINTISRNSLKPIHLLIPYLSYARQDREIAHNAPLSSKVIADLLSHQPITTVSVVEMHSPQIQGFFSKPCFNISLKDCFVNLRKLLLPEVEIADNGNLKNFVVVAPDVGAAKSSRQIANALGAPLAIVEKFRYGPGDSEVMGIAGDVNGKICVIFDDIIDSAGTLCNAADMLKKQGASRIYAFATHGIFSGEAQKKIENSAFERVYVSKSIVKLLQTNKIDYIDVADYVIQEFEKRVKNF